KLRAKLPRFKIKFSKELIRKSIPYAVLIMLMMIYGRTDSVMLERMMHDKGYESGVYAQGYRLLDAGNMFAMLFAVLLLPMFSKMIKENEKVHQLVYSSTRLILVFSIPLAIVVAFYPHEILNLRYEVVSDVSADSFTYLMYSFTGICITYIYGTLLTANGSLKQLNIMALIGILVNILLNLILIPEYGAKGAAVATCVTQGLTALIQFGIAQYLFRFSVLDKLLLPVVVYAVLVFVLTIIINESVDTQPVIPLIIYSISLLLAWFTGNIRVRPFLNYVKNRNGT